MPPVKPVPLDSEEYKNMLDYLAVLENFCKEYDIPVAEAVEYFKTPI